MEPGKEGEGGPPLFTPNEELVTTLMTLGFTRNAALRALFYTGNASADIAATWLFENQDTEDLDTPLENELLGTSDSSEDELLESGDFYKMVFVVNLELNMGVGKVAAQVILSLSLSLSLSLTLSLSYTPLSPSLLHPPFSLSSSLLFPFPSLS